MSFASAGHGLGGVAGAELVVEVEEGAGVGAGELELAEDLFDEGLLFDLFIEKPLEMGLGGVVVVLGGELVELVDRGGVGLLLFEGGFEDCGGLAEVRVWSGDVAEGDFAAAVEEVAEEALGVELFLVVLDVHPFGESG